MWVKQAEQVGQVERTGLAASLPAEVEDVEGTSGRSSRVAEAAAAAAAAVRAEEGRSDCDK